MHLSSLLTHLCHFSVPPSYLSIQSFTLPITTPDLALLVLKVMDSDVNADDFIAQVLLLLLLLIESNHENYFFNDIYC